MLRHDVWRSMAHCLTGNARRTVFAASIFVGLCLTAACQSEHPAIVLFTGTGTSPGDVRAVAQVLRDNGFSYAAVDSRQFDAMSDAQLRAYRLLIVPGGNFVEIGNGLAASTTVRIRTAVQGGLNYLGICGGAFFAGDLRPNGLNLTDGVRFPFYAVERDGIRKAAVPIAAAGEPTRDHYWEDGPQLSGWGQVVATYPDGTPAIAQGTVGNGWVMLSGIHPEAPDSWRRGLSFSTPAGEDNAYAAKLIAAALNHTALPHY